MDLQILQVHLAHILKDWRNLFLSEEYFPNHHTVFNILDYVTFVLGKTCAIVQYSKVAHI